MAFRAKAPERNGPWWAWFTEWEGWSNAVDCMAIHEGEKLPRGYGVAWRDLMRDQIVVMPVPINVVVGLVRRAWDALRFHTAGVSRLDIIRHEAYMRGYARASDVEGANRKRATKRAYDDGFRDGSEDALDKMVAHSRGEWP